MPRVLFCAGTGDWPVWRPHLAQACAAQGLAVELIGETDRPETVDYLVYSPAGAIQDFAPFIRTKAVLSLWAGVERIAGNATLTQPLCRMVDPGLTQGMVEWVLGHTLRRHLGMDAHLGGQDGVWRNRVVPPLAQARGVGVLGLGVLGAAAAQALAGLGFAVHGWSRSLKRIPGVETHAGAEGLQAVLHRSEILIALLPATPATDGLLDADALALLPRGACVLNPGRGELIDDAALLAALDAGQIGAATLDVFRGEPLDAAHPYWAHPRVTVTPHIASATRPETASATLAENIRRGEAGLPFLHVVDRTFGY